MGGYTDRSMMMMVRVTEAREVEGAALLVLEVANVKVG